MAKTTVINPTQDNGKDNATSNGPVKSGIPFGSMKPPKELVQAFHQQAGLESKLTVSREEIKLRTAKFYASFKEKFPKAGLADFARQLDKDVPFKREEYKRNPVYLSIDNMFRYMPEVKTGGKAESPEAREARLAKAKREIDKKKKARKAQNERAIRLLVSIVNQIGIPPTLFEIAAQRCGFKSSEVETMLQRKDALQDIGLGTYQMVVRASGVSAIKALAQTKQKKSAASQLPTAAELANAAKGQPVVTESPLKNVTPTTEKTYQGKGSYIMKKGDNLSATRA